MNGMVLNVISRQYEITTRQSHLTNRKVSNVPTREYISSIKLVYQQDSIIPI